MRTGPRITFVVGDIADQDVDAVVNAANSGLLGGGGVDGAIHAAAGPTLLAACRHIRATRYPEGLPPGEAVTTEGGDLLAKHVIHAVGPRYHDDPDPARTLAAAHVNALREADRVRARSVAFPAISTGAFGFPVDEAASIAVSAVRTADTDVAEVRFVLFDAATYAVFSSHRER